MQYSTSSENYSTTFKDKPSKWGGKSDGKGGYAYKKASYQYGTSANNNYSYSDKSADQNIDQLDALLEDLKNERQVTREKELISSPTQYRTIEREPIEPLQQGGTVTKTTKVMKTSKQLSGSQYLDDIEKYATSDYSTLRSNSGFSTLRDYPKNDDYRTREITYETNKSHNVPINTYETKSEIYRSNRLLENIEPVQLTVPKATTTTTTAAASSSTTTSHLEKDLQDIALTDDILPVPGTKVTTTVRTYTYEIPANAPTALTTNRSLNYSTMQRNESSNVSSLMPPQASPNQLSPNSPQTVLYNTETYSTYKNSEPPIVSNRTYEIREHHESNKMQRNLTPQPPRSQISGPPGGNTSKTIVYNVNTTENVHHLPEHPLPHSPSHSPQIQPANGITPIYAGYPPPPSQGPTTSRYFYKESSNVVNTIHGPPNGGVPINELPPVKRSPSGGFPPVVVYPPAQPSPQIGQPPQTTTYNYKYSSTSTNTRRGAEYGASPAPAPFPVDDVEYPIGNGSPPQRVEELMQSFGNPDAVDKSDIEIPHRKREVETAVASPQQPQIPTVNKAGREIYYPPGHDTMIMKREEMAAGSAAGGRWAKGSGNYEYESGYKSKSKSKSGGAMVPVCLPLCCAMPCSIM